MRHCPNSDCPHRLRFGHPSEFTEVVSECRDCGAALVQGDAPLVRERLHAPPWAAVVVTLVAMLGTIAMGRIPLPGVSPPSWMIAFDTSAMSIGTLGLYPFLTAALLVEIGAVLVPRWRALRTTGRRKLTRATIVLTLVLAFLQAFGIVRYLESTQFVVTMAPALLMLTLVAGVFAQLALARLVDFHGLGNGVAVSIAASIAASFFDLGRRVVENELLDRASAAFVLVLVAGIMLATARFVGRKFVHRGVALRLPLSGIDPVLSASGLLLLPVTIANLGVKLPPIPLTPDTITYSVVLLVLVVAITLALSLLFHRPANVAEETGESRGAIVASRRRALRPTLAYVLAIAVAGLVLQKFPLGIVASNVALLGVVGLDMIEEASARRRAHRWVGIASLHRTYALDPLLDRLRAAKIDAIPRAVRTRAFFQFFAPWAPIEVIVPENDVARAREAVLSIVA